MGDHDLLRTQRGDQVGMDENSQCPLGLTLTPKLIVCEMRCSVRVSNELGAGRPRAAQFAIVVVLISSAIIGIFFVGLVLSLRDVFGDPFTNSPAVSTAVSSLAVLFSITLLLNSIQPVLTGKSLSLSLSLLLSLYLSIYLSIYLYLSFSWNIYI